MKRFGNVVLAVGLVLATAVQAQTNVRIRGTITTVDGNALAVTTRDGRDLKLEPAANLAISVARAARFDELEADDLVGITSTPGADGTPVALEVHYLPPTARWASRASRSARMG
jgi:hypothetical protein